MPLWLDIILAVLTLLTLMGGLVFGILRFGIRRGRATFLSITIRTAISARNGPVALVNLVVRLENKGGTRINARTKTDIGGGPWLYNDEWDRCEHAGTLKVRPIPVRDSAWVLDWYALSPMLATVERCKRGDEPRSVVSRSGDLEQINYLGEYQDPIGNYEDVDFWLEPREAYDLTVPLWLPYGTYAAKASFLGRRGQRGEEEYWSSTHVFGVDPPTRDA